jgi:hypothetical protein
VAQSWVVWLIRNKLTMESKLINHPAVNIFKTMLFVQLWSLLAKPQDRPCLKGVASMLKQLHAAVVASD